MLINMKSQLIFKFYLILIYIINMSIKLSIKDLKDLLKIQTKQIKNEKEEIKE